MATRERSSAAESNSHVRGRTWSQGQAGTKRPQEPSASPRQTDRARQSSAVGYRHTVCHSCVSRCLCGCRSGMEGASLGRGFISCAERSNLHRLRHRQVRRNYWLVAYPREHSARAGTRRWMARRTSGTAAPSPQIHKARVQAGFLGNRTRECYRPRGSVYANRAIAYASAVSPTSLLKRSANGRPPMPKLPRFDVKKLHPESPCCDSWGRSKYRCMSRRRHERIQAAFPPGRSTRDRESLGERRTGKHVGQFTEQCRAGDKPDLAT